MTPCCVSAGFIITVRDSLSAEEEADALLDAVCSLMEESDSLADIFSVRYGSAELFWEDDVGAVVTEEADLLAGKDSAQSDLADDSSASGSGVADSDKTTTEEGAVLDDVGSAVVVLESLPA